MPADALAPKVTSALVGMALAMQDRQHVLLFLDLNSSTWDKPNPRYDSKWKFILVNFKTIQHVKS